MTNLLNLLGYGLRKQAERAATEKQWDKKEEQLRKLEKQRNDMRHALSSALREIIEDDDHHA